MNKIFENGINEAAQHLGVSNSIVMQNLAAFNMTMLWGVCQQKFFPYIIDSYTPEFMAPDFVNDYDKMAVYFGLYQKLNELFVNTTCFSNVISKPFSDDKFKKAFKGFAKEQDKRAPWKIIDNNCQNGGTLFMLKHVVAKYGKNVLKNKEVHITGTSPVSIQIALYEIIIHSVMNEVPIGKIIAHAKSFVTADKHYKNVVLFSCEHNPKAYRDNTNFDLAA